MKWGHDLRKIPEKKNEKKIPKVIKKEWKQKIKFVKDLIGARMKI